MVKHNPDPWGSEEIKLDEKLIKEFGLRKFDKKNLPFDNYFFERGIILAHRDFGAIYDCIKNKKPFIQLTGIATSGPFHLGHKLDIDIFLMFKKLGAKSFFAVCDIDAYVSRPDSKLDSLAKAKEIAVDNVAHLLAFGVERKDIYVQSRKEPRYYEFAFELSKKITENAFKAIYGHLNLGKVSANLLQYADILHLQLKEYLGPMPSITGIGVEQDPHARATRDIARKLPYKMKMPSFVYFMHQSGLQEGRKMSASYPETAIFLDDSPKEIKTKINKAFSGGRKTVEEHRKLGGIPEIDKAYEILFFHHPDSKFVQEVYNKYKSGEMLTGELKKICIDFLTEFIVEHKKKVEANKKLAREIVYGK
jgi:tryptophanyl-tRNA synthetase